MTAGSSCGTSEMASVRTRAGAAICGEPPALDAREVFSHRVDLGDVGARAQQRSGDALLLVERELAGRRDPVGRAAPGQQHQDEIVPFGGAGERERLAGCGDAMRVRHRMAGLDHRDGAGRLAVAVPRDREADELFWGRRRVRGRRRRRRPPCFRPPCRPRERSGAPRREGRQVRSKALARVRRSRPRCRTGAGAWRAGAGGRVPAHAAALRSRGRASQMPRRIRAPPMSLNRASIARRGSSTRRRPRRSPRGR